MIGMQIESYQIQEKLGEGGMGTVYRALETNLDRIVAIKVLNSDLARDAAFVERFRSEARAQANLNHANIATLYSFFVHQGSPIMVMEYVDGESMQQVVERRGPIPAQEAIPLFRQALLGVGAAHRLGIVHRDIKPSNLMLNRAGIVKVMDFGIAKLAAVQRGLTRTGSHVGTAYYMSPEQVKGERVDNRSDIYALGVTLYELSTANVPFSGSSEFQILNDHVNTPPPPPSKFYPYLPKALEAIILKAIEKNPDDRFQTVDEFGAALEHPETWEHVAPRSAGLFGDSLVKTSAAAAGTSASGALQSPAATPRSSVGVASMPEARQSKAGTDDAGHPPSPAASSAAVIPQSTGLAAKLGVAATLFVCVALGAAYMLSRGKANSAPDSKPVSSQRAPHSEQQPLASRGSDEMKPVLTNLAGDSPGTASDSRNATGAPDNAAPGAKDLREGVAVPQPSSNKLPGFESRHVASIRHNPASQSSSPPVVPPPANPSPTVQSGPVASQADLDEAHQRFIRLRSKAIALKNNLADMRRRLAEERTSMRSDVIEAESNMDSYMLEADRAIQAGNVQSAQDNMNMAEHEAKKIAAAVGG